MDEVDRQQLVDLAKAALAVAEGEAKPEDFPPEIAARLGEVKLETVQLHRAATTVAVRYLIDGLQTFLEVAAEQGMVPDTGNEICRAIAGQISTAMVTEELDSVISILEQAKEIREELKVPDETTE